MHSFEIEQINVFTFLQIIVFYYVICLSVLPVYIYIHAPPAFLVSKMVRRWLRIPQDWRYRYLWAALWVDATPGCPGPQQEQQGLLITDLTLRACVPFLAPGTGLWIWLEENEFWGLRLFSLRLCESHKVNITICHNRYHLLRRTKNQEKSIFYLFSFPESHPFEYRLSAISNLRLTHSPKKAGHHSWRVLW